MPANKKYFWIVGLCIMIFASFINPDSNFKDDTVSKSSSQIALNSMKPKKKKLSINRIKLGMTKEQVIKVAGKPDYDSNSATYLKYGEHYIYFRNKKVSGGDTNNLEKEVKKQADEKEKKQREKREIIKYQAQRIGQKTVESLQKGPYPYNSIRVDGGMMYSIVYKNASFYRLDTDDGYTSVFLQDKNAPDGLGELLYTGKTLIRDKPQQVITY
ncbi:hypothetical protein [Pediococcus pentosaceus]|uniref:hypothetical protein n=1 Tax=Pediococcus pentosaceus TaxID=1255 RepID=UPI0039819626